MGWGDAVKLWLDNWIPSLQFHKPIGPATLEALSLCMNELIEHSKGGWNENLIRKSFNDIEENSIIKVMPSRVGIADQLV